MKLSSLPDCKKVHPMLSVGNEYEILGEFGDGYIIKLDNSEERIIILKSRFE